MFFVFLVFLRFCKLFFMQLKIVSKITYFYSGGKQRFLCRRKWPILDLRFPTRQFRSDICQNSEGIRRGPPIDMVIENVVLGPFFSSVQYEHHTLTQHTNTYQATSKQPKQAEQQQQKGRRVSAAAVVHVWPVAGIYAPSHHPIFCQQR